MPLSLAAKALAAAIALGSFGAYELAPPDMRGQTVFLERLSLRVDRAPVIAPETAAALSGLLVRIRSQHPRGGDLEARHELAIARIERALQTKISFGGVAPDAQSSPVARR